MFQHGNKNMRPPIGISDFRKLILNTGPRGEPYLFIDKSLFIKDVIDDPSEVMLINRPRRFGKTLNLSMLQHFFSEKVNNFDTKVLFNNLKISEYKEYMHYQGKSPVISLTFKDIKNISFSGAYDDCVRLISKAYEEHEQLLSDDSKLTERQKKQFELVLNREAAETDVRASLQDLTIYLHQHYGTKPYILIDEYDTPIQTAYLEGYYKEMVTFMREFLGAGLKDNSHLNKAILTGILRISKESLFSGLNNLKVYSLLNARYGQYFGFTEEEVYELLEKTHFENLISEVRTWYNGYQVGNTILYNPWSIVNFIQEDGKFSPYWVNTSDNALIKDLLIRSSTNFKIQFESLLQGDYVEKFINENIIFEQLNDNESALWTLLLTAGYLKITSIKDMGQGALCQLEIPNKEVKDLYRVFIAEWLSGVNDATVFNYFLTELLNGNVDNFEENLRRMLLQIFSVHDVKGKQPEKFFHGFMLGLVSGVDLKQYKIDSNKEAGFGRFDIIIAPIDPNKLGIILELKSIDKGGPEALIEAADAALLQIDKNQYHMAPLLQDVRNCLKIGIAFSGKDLAVKYHK